MNSKGNVLILGLLILQVIFMVSMNFSLNLDHLSNINRYDPSFECAKIKAIQRIEYEFRKGKEKDFEFDSDGYHVEVIYGFDECEVIFEGEHEVVMRVAYDPAYWAIGSVEYDFENWE